METIYLFSISWRHLLDYTDQLCLESLSTESEQVLRALLTQQMNQVSTIFRNTLRYFSYDSFNHAIELLREVTCLIETFEHAVSSANTPLCTLLLQHTWNIVMLFQRLSKEDSKNQRLLSTSLDLLRRVSRSEPPDSLLCELIDRQLCPELEAKQRSIAQYIAEREAELARQRRAEEQARLERERRQRQEEEARRQREREEQERRALQERRERERREAEQARLARVRQEEEACRQREREEQERRELQESRDQEQRRQQELLREEEKRQQAQAAQNISYGWVMTPFGLYLVEVPSGSYGFTYGMYR